MKKNSILLFTRKALVISLLLPGPPVIIAAPESREVKDTSGITGNRKVISEAHPDDAFSGDIEVMIYPGLTRIQ